MRIVLRGMLIAAASFPLGASGQGVGEPIAAGSGIRSSRVTVYGANPALLGVLENSTRDGTIIGTSWPSPDGLRIVGRSSEVFLRWEDFDSVRVRRDHPFFTNKVVAAGALGLLAGGVVAAVAAKDAERMHPPMAAVLGFVLARRIGIGGRDTMFRGGRPAALGATVATGVPIALLRTSAGTAKLLPGMTLVLDRVPFCIGDGTPSPAAIIAVRDSGLIVRAADGREGVLLIGAEDVGLERPIDFGVPQGVGAAIVGAGATFILAPVVLIPAIFLLGQPTLSWVAGAVTIAIFAATVTREANKAKQHSVAYGRLEGPAAPPPLPAGVCAVRWATVP